MVPCWNGEDVWFSGVSVTQGMTGEGMTGKMCGSVL